MFGSMLGIILLFVMVAIFGRIVAGSFDDGRVRQYIESRGGTLLEKHWSPMGKGWYGEKDSRIYEVRYRDAEGNIHQATCKTSMMSGVYFTEDEIVGYADAPAPDVVAVSERATVVQDDPAELRQEIERLRKENEALVAENRELKHQRPLF